MPNCHTCIVLQLPPRGSPISNDRLYRDRGDRRRLPRAAHLAHDPHSRPRLHRRHRAHRPGRPPLDGPLLDAVAGRRSASCPASTTRSSSNNRLKFAVLFILAGVLLALALLGLRAAVTAVPAALLVNLALGMGTGLERGAPRAPRSPRGRRSSRSPSPASAAASPRCLRSTAGVVALYAFVMVDATGVAGGEPVRPDPELALLGDRQPGRDAAARAAPRGRVPRPAPVRDPRLRPVRRLRPRRDDGQPARCRRWRRDRARRRARRARDAPVQARGTRLRRPARVRGARRALDRLARPGGARARITCAARSRTTARDCSRRSRAACRSPTCPRCTRGSSSFRCCSCSRSRSRSRGAPRDSGRPGISSSPSGSRS